MERAEIRELVEGVPAGTKLKMTFVRLGPRASLFELHREIVAGHLRLDAGQNLFFHAVMDSNDWCTAPTLDAMTTDTFDPASFANQLFRVLVSIKVEEPVSQDYFVFIDVEANQAKLIKDNGRETRLLAECIEDPNKRIFVKRLPRQTEAKALVDLINGSLVWLVGVRGEEFSVTCQYDGFTLPPMFAPVDDVVFKTHSEALASYQ